MRQEHGRSPDYQATRGKIKCLVAPFKSTTPGWRYFNTPIANATKINKNNARRWTKQREQLGYTDDIIITGNSPHGADLVHNDEHDAPHREENAAVPAKLENPTSPVSIRIEPAEVFMKYGIRITLTIAEGIKTQGCMSRATVSIFTSPSRVCSICKMCQDATNPCLCSPAPGTRRWLSGAPGGWWPTFNEARSSDDDGPSYSPPYSPIDGRRREPLLIEIDSSDDEPDPAIEVVEILSSDDELPTQPPPLKKRRVELMASFESSSPTAAPIDPSQPGPVPQPGESPHSSLPQEVLHSSSTMLSHGSSNKPLHLIEHREDDLDICSTTALASSSTSAYSSGGSSGDEETDDTALRSSQGRSQQQDTILRSTQEGILLQTTDVPPPGQQVPQAAAGARKSQRRSRAERNARNAKWPCSLQAQLASSEFALLELDSDSDDEQCTSEVSCASEMIFSLAEYDRLVAVFRATRDPDDGELLYNYVGDAVKRRRRALHLQKWRRGKKEEELRQLRAELRAANELVDDLQETFGPAAPLEPQPGPSGISKPVEKKAPKKKKSATKKCETITSSHATSVTQPEKVPRINQVPTQSSLPTSTQHPGMPSTPGTWTYPTWMHPATPMTSTTSNAPSTTASNDMFSSAFTATPVVGLVPVVVTGRITQTRQIDFMALLDDLPSMASPMQPLRQQHLAHTASSHCDSAALRTPAPMHIWPATPTPWTETTR
ncbi:hypothetical protein QAD02_015247 [Eretmocerus hayati]|uniref:Uncharacterized protein n=1 Tax=Eretmocerus hayati TaxID=131215 RepID=A0ACC2P7R9_9HYME|nr:hypothetical protein QAD02_015247 [Eretmocerus hayati]